ncbi:hypothetical protein LX32DRAFT_628846 [Colletotrichum zoysiae]|uniref:Uncharacterized protein n=1 Tax=Colletotrichum zoysiae TaxID=1216348 RepID=A0AAD9H5T5_9PEZI|nr:hypothetical protein LX32DRAFT_628846 [Colletotrichum zoysiae]
MAPSDLLGNLRNRRLFLPAVEPLCRATTGPSRSFPPEHIAMWAGVCPLCKSVVGDTKITLQTIVISRAACRPIQNRKKENEKHTTPGIRWSSPTQLLIRPSLAYLWESGRDPEFSNGYGRMWQFISVEQTILQQTRCFT